MKIQNKPNINLQNLKIVTIGGGSGGFVIDRGLSKYFENLISITTSFDSGGSSGILRDEFGILPQGDIRRRILAQSHTDTQILRELFSYRFQEEKSNLHDHSLGNLILTAATKIWGEQEGIDTISKLFGVTGRILPVSLGKSDLKIKLSDESYLIGETQIDNRDKKDERKIESISLTKKVFLNNEVKKAILDAGYIILCPGDFYTSLVPNFLVTGFREVIQKSKAKIIYFSNIMTKVSETRDYKLSDFVKIGEQYCGKKFDYILYDNKEISKKVLQKYKSKENSQKVLCDINENKRLIISDLQNINSNILRHDSELCAEVVLNIIYNRNKVFVWDLDDTLVKTSGLEKEYLIKDFKNLKFFKNVKKILETLGKEKCILLTYDKYGLQNLKIKKLGLSKFFSDIMMVKNKKDKYINLENIKNSHPGQVVVIGDSHEGGELEYAKKLNLKTICVAMPDSKNLDKNKHPQYDFIIEKEEDFLGILEIAER